MEWYEKCLGQGFDFDDITLSVKLQALFEIINICFHLKDKLIVFSQSVITLDIIEGFLASSTLDTLKGKFLNVQILVFGQKYRRRFFLNWVQTSVRLCVYKKFFRQNRAYFEA